MRIVDPIATRDIALEVLSTSAAIAAILLVFVGFMIVKLQLLSDSATAATKRSYTRTAQVGLIPIIVQVTVMVCAYAWLFWPYSPCLYRFWTVGFVIGLGLFLAYAIYATMRL